MGDRGIAMHQREGDGEGGGGGEAGPGRAGPRGGRGGGEGGTQHLALEADIDDASALAEQPAERRENQRRRQAQRRRQQRDGLDEEIVAHAGALPCPPPLAGEGRVGGASRRASGRRKRFSSAPQNRMISPSMTMTSSRCNFGISKASSLPP